MTHQLQHKKISDSSTSTTVTHQLQYKKIRVHLLQHKKISHSLTSTQKMSVTHQSKRIESWDFRPPFFCSKTLLGPNMNKLNWIANFFGFAKIFGYKVRNLCVQAVNYYMYWLRILAFGNHLFQIYWVCKHCAVVDNVDKRILGIPSRKQKNLPNCLRLFRRGPGRVESMVPLSLSFHRFRIHFVVLCWIYL